MALSLVPGLGIVRLHQLLKRWGAPGEILRLPSAELKACRLSSEIRKSIVGGGALRSAERVIRETRERGISLLSFYDPGYPQRLKEIHQPPRRTTRDIDAPIDQADDLPRVPELLRCDGKAPELSPLAEAHLVPALIAIDICDRCRRRSVSLFPRRLQHYACHRGTVGGWRRSGTPAAG